jgi:YegS/Rv2252/BmrU family lipid kinase
MARALLIFNPTAARANPRVVRTVSRVLGAEGWDVDVVGTTRSEDAGRLAREAVAQGVETVAVYGGDGTTMQAVRGIVGTGVTLGLVPGGTGNLLARNLRLPLDPARAARAMARGVPRPVDLGRITRPAGDQYFAVAAGAGFDAQVMGETTSAAKRRWKLAAYLGTAWQIILRDLVNVPCRVTVDGTVLDGDAATVLILNCPELFPPFLPVWHDVRPDDGVFDVLALRARNVVEGLGMVWQLLVTKSGGNGAVMHARGRHVTVETDPARPVQFDGETGGETPFTAELLPGELKVLVPRD